MKKFKMSDCSVLFSQVCFYIRMVLDLVLKFCASCEHCYSTT